MQKDQRFKLEVSSKAEVDSRCSCPHCDSTSCFLKRRDNDHCGCSTRASSELHAHSCQNSKLTTDINSISDISILFQELIAPDINPKKASYFDKEVIQILNESVKETKEDVISDSTTTIFKISNTSFSQERFTDSCEKSKKDKGSNVYCYRKKAFCERSENVKLPKDAACQNMSAAVEHSMPYQELQAPIPKTKMSHAVVKLSAADIYNKIKEAYKACSCEVCECVVGKSLQNEYCGCKPCECNDCANISECELNYVGTEFIQKKDEQCFCLLCDRKSCKLLGDTEKTIQDFHGHRENIESQKYGRDCDCKHCECIKSKSRSIHRTLIVAPTAVDGSLQPHSGCQCSPCECLECSNSYGVTTNGQREISTYVNRHLHCHCELCDNETCIPDSHQSCRCVRQNKVMNKPVEQDSHDYDIRTAHVTYNKKGICERNFETLAMFAAVPTSYTNRVDQIKQCNCDYCECLNCEYLDHRTDSQNIFPSFPKSYQIDREVQGKIKYCKPKILNHFKNRHVSDMCDCTDCYNLVNSCAEDKKGTGKLSRKCSCNRICSCNICKIVEYEKKITNCFNNRGEDASVDISRLMKSKRKTQLKNDDPLIKSCIDTLESNKKIFRQYQFSMNASKSSISVNNFGESHHPTYRQACYGSHRIFYPNYETESVVHETISECPNEIDLRRHNKQALHSSLSLVSSKSFVKESESVIPVTSKVKSRESSCNSSGYDYPEYLAHFPKLSIKTGFDDVMHYNLRNNVMFNVGSNNKIVTNFNERDRKSFQSQIRTEHSSPNIKVNCKASQTFHNDVQNKVSQVRYLAKEKRKIYSPMFEVYPSNEFDKIKTDSASTSTTDTNTEFAFNKEYIRVQKTLQDAREYSQHLVSLFKKYEKANNEFESVSKRIKNSNCSTDLNIKKYAYQTNNSIKKDTIIVQDVPTKDSECTFTSAFDEIYCTNKPENSINDRDNINSSEKATNIFKKENIFHSKGRNHELNSPFKNTNQTIDINKQKKNTKNLNKRPIHVTKRSQDLIIAPQRSSSNLNKIDDKQGVVTVKNSSDIVVISDSHSLGNHKHFQESLDNNVKDTREDTDGDFHDNVNTSQANVANKIEREKIIKTIEDRNNIIMKRDFNYKTTTTLSKNSNLPIKCNTELLNILKSKKIVKTKSENSKLLLENVDTDKKSYEIKQEEIVSLPTPNESDGKSATQVMSHQSVDKHPTFSNKSKAMENVLSEVKRILDLPFLRVIKSQKESFHDKNCEAMKVTTLIAHRISDHSVAVRWKAPSLFKNVKGYEVLIDGRFVQRITNPSRRMAVISCLPHAEKILLTVRTVVTVPVSDHYPAATLVYHTRKKSETLIPSRASIL